MDSKQRSRGKAWKDAGVSLAGVLGVASLFLLSPEGAELLGQGPGWLLAAIPTLQWLAKYFLDQQKHRGQIHR